MPIDGSDSTAVAPASAVTKRRRRESKTGSDDTIPSHVVIKPV
jgi:hypothetical protein